MNMEQTHIEEQSRRLYRAVWRWHFYAGIFCIPLVVWLACTGSIYLFKPQIERWLDRPYDHIAAQPQRQTPEHIVQAALVELPGGMLHSYELPLANTAAVRVLIGKGHDEFRVYVNPYTLDIMNVVNEDRRPMKVLARMHGQLLAGDLGSRLVELAASWAIVLVVSGLVLWWPRQTERFAGVLWIRLHKGSSIFWRDVHAVTGVWVSALALFLLLTGLPWAVGWGAYLKHVRAWTGTAVARQDWTSGRSQELRQRSADQDSIMTAMNTEHAMHGSHGMNGMYMPSDYSPLNVLVPAAQRLHFAYPVLVQPPLKAGGPWTVKSDAQNRSLRSSVTMDAGTATVLSREDFQQRQIIDRVLGIGIAAHEGQLFGIANQLLGLITALGLVLLCISACVMWWRRRHAGVLGAPLPMQPPRATWALGAVVGVLALYLPEMAVSLALLLLLERFVLRRIPPARRWLGLSPA